MQIAQRWILARLRNQPFFSLDELNARIAELLDELNDAHDAPLPREPPRALRAARPPGPQAAAGDALRRTASGRRRASTSTTTSRSTTTTTRRRTSCVGADVWIRATGRPRSRSSTRATSASPRTCAATSAGGTRPPPSTCRSAPQALRVDAARIVQLGRGRSARTPRRWSRRSSPTARTPSRATARASASCASASATATSGSRPRVPARSPPAPARTATSSRSCSNGLDRVAAAEDRREPASRHRARERPRRDYYH